MGKLLQPGSVKPTPCAWSLAACLCSCSPALYCSFVAAASALGPLWICRAQNPVKSLPVPKYILHNIFLTVFTGRCILLDSHISRATHLLCCLCTVLVEFVRDGLLCVVKSLAYFALTSFSVVLGSLLVSLQVLRESQSTAKTACACDVCASQSAS